MVLESIFWTLRHRTPADEPIRVESVTAHLDASGLLHHYPFVLRMVGEMDREMLSYRAEKRDALQQQANAKAAGLGKG